MIRIKTFVIDADDSTMGETSAYIERLVNQKIEEMEEKVEILDVIIMEARTSYSRPIEGSYRDDHYTEHGFIGVIKYRPKML